jgi:tRNA wybutosine-synthesizing protein 3
MSSPEARFAVNKSRILAEIASTAPDASPKGSIDVQILSLINQLNQHDRVFTTSSCSGRISVFFEGVKKSTEPIDSEELQGDDRGNRAGQAGMGGKGEGGKWLFVSHDPVSDVEKRSNREIAEMLFRGEKDKAVTDTASDEGGLCEPVELEMGDVVDFDISSTTRFVHLKFEPMVCGGEFRIVKAIH